MTEAASTGAPLEPGDERCPGRAAHAAAQWRLGAVLAATAGLTLARQLTRTLCALTIFASLAEFEHNAERGITFVMPRPRLCRDAAGGARLAA